MPSCAAFGCINRSSNRADLIVRKILSEKKTGLRKLWINNIKRTGYISADSGFYISVQSISTQRNLKVHNRTDSLLYYIFITIHIVCNSLSPVKSIIIVYYTTKLFSVNVSK